MTPNAAAAALTHNASRGRLANGLMISAGVCGDEEVGAKEVAGDLMGAGGEWRWGGFGVDDGDGDGGGGGDDDDDGDGGGDDDDDAAAAAATADDDYDNNNK